MSTLTVRWLYGDKIVDLALSRGWTEDQALAHAEAIADESESTDNQQATDRMALTHPYNYLTEAEVESLSR